MNPSLPLSQEEVRLFENLFLETCGIRLDQKQHPFILLAFTKRIQEKGFQSYQDYYHFIKYHPEGDGELRELIDLLTVMDTHFFRNKAHFDLLIETVLPEIIKRKEKTGERGIRCWSAGCATGDEAYSLAIALMEVLPSPSDWDISILGTDINRNGLAVAKRGVYPKSHLAHLPQTYLNKYFKREGSNHRLIPEIKEMVQFMDHNLSRDPFTNERMQALDLLFCRNVLIYLDERSTRRILEGFYHCLLPGGYLFLGHAEILWQMDHQFETILFPQTFVYRKRVSAGIIQPPCFGRKELIEARERSPLPVLRSALSMATQLANEGKYQEASDLLCRWVAEDPLAVEAHYLLGTLWLNSNRFEEAEVQFKRVLYLRPQAVMAHFHLGTLYLRKGRTREAYRILRNAVQILEMKPKEEKVEFCEELTVEFLLGACQKLLARIPKGGSLNERR